MIGRPFLYGNGSYPIKNEGMNMVRELRLSVFVAAFLLLQGCTDYVSVDTEIRTRYPVVERIVAIGDLHGDMDVTRRAFRLAGAIDDEDHWIGGKLVIVQTGDQLDRGGEEQAILEFLARLTEEAAEAGGAVHVLNGNHELMNVSLDLRYITEDGFEDFQDAVVVDESDSLIASYEPHQRARIAAFRPGGPFAALMARRNTIVIIGENVFVHGGLLPEHVEYGIDRLNEEIRSWMRGERLRPQWSRGSNSPVWSRHYSVDAEEDDAALLDEVLRSLGAKRMIVGHSIQSSGISAYCDGRVWCIDVGMAEHYGGVPKVLEIRGDTVTVLREN